MEFGLIGLLFQSPVIFVAVVVALIIAITVHEFSHALAAYLLGDLTAKEEGRLTLNPAAHLSLLGTIMLLLAGFGWGKPVPYNPYNLKNPKLSAALISLAGPASNLVLIIIFGLFLRFAYPLFNLGSNNGLFIFLFSVVFLNFILMIFNLIPIPPLDGSKLLFLLLPDSMNNVRDFLQQYGFYILIAFLLFGASLFARLSVFIEALIYYLFVPPIA